MAETQKLTALRVERAHKAGERVMLGDEGGLYFRKQTREGAAWTITNSRGISTPETSPVR
jgi:hypothetical protein